MATPFLYFAGGRLSSAELSAACLDGHLVALGDGFVPADVVETAWLRAASLAGVLGDTLAASHRTAAWVHGGLDEAPARHSVQRAVAYRLHHVIDRRLIYHDAALDAADLARLAGVAVTTPARTVADLARSGRPADDALVREWTRRDRTLAAEARGWISARSRLPHGRRALALLRRCQEDVTR